MTSAPESLFWYWISERHAIYLRRLQGKPKPWTTDPILRDCKFTNPFREHDRGTVWLRENFLQPHREDDPQLVLFNVSWYRMFNWWKTGELLGWQTDWPITYVKEKLTYQLAQGHQVFTGAHIIRSEFGRPKIDSIVDVCSNIWSMKDHLVTIARNTRSLQNTFEHLLTIPYIGPFMAYEIVTDLRHTRVLEDATDMYSWANPGPGAKRGLERLGLEWKPDAKAIEAMQGLLARSRANLPEWVPDLEMRDIEHSLCEVDKMCRVKFGGGQPRSRYPGAA